MLFAIETAAFLLYLQNADNLVKTVIAMVLYLPVLKIILVLFKMHTAKRASEAEAIMDKDCDPMRYIEFLTVLEQKDKKVKKWTFL